MTIDPAKAIADIDDILGTALGTDGVASITLLASLYQACIERWAPRGSIYRDMADRVARFSDDKHGQSHHHLGGILKTLRRDYAAGLMTSFEEIVHAAVFDDLLEQASYLLGEGYTLPSAVIAGAALEEHLRQLAIRHGISTSKPNGKPKAASELNDDLHKVVAFGQPQWRHHQAWIDLRNEAAHGKPEFADRTKTDISRMIDGIREFLIRHPA